MKVFIFKKLSWVISLSLLPFSMTSHLQGFHSIVGSLINIVKGKKRVLAMIHFFCNLEFIHNLNGVKKITLNLKM